MKETNMGCKDTQKMYMAFLDLEEEYDTVDRKGHLKVLTMVCKKTSN